MADTRQERHVDRIADLPLEGDFGRAWWIAVAIALAGVVALVVALVLSVVPGVGTWGNDVPFVWGFDLANYLWWIGNANGAALLATLLILYRSQLRHAANRLAETLGVAAAFCAALFPVIHLGRPLLAYWVAPYPASTGLWPQPLSPLTWDFWGIVAHLITLTLLWYVGLVPDLALLRDRAKRGWVGRAYGVAALGWTGSGQQWTLLLSTHRMIALSVIPFLFIMQTIVALEFATTIVPDWHDTGLPVRMVVNGFAAGLGIVLLVTALIGWALRLPAAPAGFNPLERLGRLLLATALVASFVTAVTTLVEWLGPDGSASVNTWTGSGGAWISWAGLLLGKAVPQLLWFDRVRRSRPAAMAIGLSVALGVWLDNLAVIVLALANDRLVRPEDLYVPSVVEVVLLLGSISLFALFMLVAVRVIPITAIYPRRSG